MEFKPTRITEQDRNRLANWARKYKVSLEISPAGHLVTFHAETRRAEWWPGKDRLVIDGKTKRAQVASSALEVMSILRSAWGIV